MNIILIGFFASLLAGLATGLGSLAVFFTKRISDRILDVSLGFAAGVMLAVVSFGLIIPAIEYGGIWKTVVGIILGTLFLICCERLTPHMHNVAGIKGPSTGLNRLWLLVLAMTIHNFPEGIAVGVGFGSGDIGAGTKLAIGIGLQNIPEGLAVAFPLLREGIKRERAFFIALLTGLVEPVGGLLGVSVISFSRFLFPYGLAFAAGAMLFVVCEEIIPETHSRGNDRVATIGIIFGFVIMMMLDNIII